MARDPSLDITFDCTDTDAHGNRYAGIGTATCTMHGNWLGFTIEADPIVVTVSQEGDYVLGFYVSADPITVTVSLGSPQMTITPQKSHWLKWSNIGSLDFTIWKDNVAGERPMDWKGWIWSVKKLGNRAITYGENGVSILTPHENMWGLNTIYRVGLKCKEAVCGDDKIHFFIDNTDQLWSLGESLELLDYSEYLSNMTSPVMSYDIQNGLVYICDGTYGYVYSPKEGSFGSGPVNVTGIYPQGGTLYISASSAITTPALELWTDIHDLKTRKMKTVYEMAFGTDLAGVLRASIKYRRDKSRDWVQTPWINVLDNGSVFITAMGVEFMFGVKTLVWEYLELDYWKIYGIIHAN